MQFVEQRAWLPAYGINYKVGIDGLSLWLVILTTFLTPLALLGSWSSIRTRVREFVVFMLHSRSGDDRGLLSRWTCSSSTSSGRPC